MKTQKTFEVMTPQHPRWDEFCVKLEEACEFTGEGINIKWKCGGGLDKTRAEKVLKSMKLNKTCRELSLNYFEANGGMCDCEILFNVDR